MVNDLTIPQEFQLVHAPDPAFGVSKVDPNSLSEGVAQSFPILSIRGKVFRIKYKGQESAILTRETGEPAQSLEVVIIKASPVISKIWYEGAFVEGQREAPDCFSINGLNPDPASPKKQNNFCATCSQNIWGSRTVNGKAAKACQDNKRLAIVPKDDMRNEMFGGPILLRIPPASLQDMSAFQTRVQQYGQQYYTVSTRLSFDYEVAHPKIKFQPIAPLTGQFAQICVEMQEHPQVQRMLAEGVEFVRGEEGDQPAPPPAAPTGVHPGGVPQHAQGFPQTSPLGVSTAPPPPPPPVFPTAPPAGQVQAQARPQPAVVAGVDQGGDAGPIPEFLVRQPAQPAGAPLPASVTFGAGPQVQATAPPVVLPQAAAAAPQPAPAQVALDPAVAALQQQIAELKASLAAAAAPATRRPRKPPSPAPTAGAAAPQPSTATVATPPATVQPQGGIVFGAPTPATQAQPAPDPVEASTTVALPADLDAELDQLLKQ